MTWRLVIVAVLLCWFAPGAAAGQESAERPFSLAPASDLSLSGPDERDPAPPCAEFTLYLTDQRPPGCPRVAAAAPDTPADTPPQEREPPQPPSQIKKPLHYRIIPYLVPIGVLAGG